MFDPVRPTPRPGSIDPWIDRAIARITPRVLPADSSAVRPLGDGIWFHERDLCSARQGPRIPTRTAIVRLRDGSLWVWSPLPPEPELVAAIATLGPVRSVLAPSTLHHLWTAQFAAAVGAPELWASPGLAEKDATLRGASVLHDDAKPSWADEFSWRSVGPLGSFVEVLCYHRPTRVLFVVDLAFHLAAMPRRIDRWYWSLYGSYGRFAPSHIMRLFLRRDRTAVRNALRAVADWPFERIFVAHGSPVIETASARFLDGFAQWLR